MFLVARCVVYCLLFEVCCLLCVVGPLMFVVCYLLFVACALLFVGYCCFCDGWSLVSVCRFVCVGCVLLLLFVFAFVGSQLFVVCCLLRGVC